MEWEGGGGGGGGGGGMLQDLPMFSEKKKNSASFRISR